MKIEHPTSDQIFEHGKLHELVEINYYGQIHTGTLFSANNSAITLHIGNKQNVPFLIRGIYYIKFDHLDDISEEDDFILLMVEIMEQDKHGDFTYDYFDEKTGWETSIKAPGRTRIINQFTGKHTWSEFANALKLKKHDQ